MLCAVDFVSSEPEVVFAEQYEYDTNVFWIERYGDIIREAEKVHLSTGERKSEQQGASGLAETA